MFRNVVKTYCKIYKIGDCNSISKRFAGHSKWSNIRHIKGLKDGQRANLFLRLSRQMRIAIQEGGSNDPKSNLRLEQVIEQARRMSMPIASIQSTIKGAVIDKKIRKKYILELKGPGNCLILCEIFTDNFTRTKQAVAPILRKNSTKLADSGILNVFEHKGVIETNLPDITSTPEELVELATEHAIESGAEDLKLMENEALHFFCGVTCLKAVQVKLESLGYKITSASVEYIPTFLKKLSDSDLETCAALYEKLENLEDVVKLYDNIA